MTEQDESKGVPNKAVKRTSISREELYENVWSTPMRTLCKELGLSDRGLAKLCKRENVPFPGRGYWNKIQAGIELPKTPLPTVERNIPVFIGGGQQQNKIPIENRPEIIVSKTLRNPHPLVMKTSEIHKAWAKKDYSRRDEPTLDVRVTDEYLGRALRIMDAFIKALEAAGNKVEVKGDRRTVAVVDGEAIQFHIEERQRRVENTEEKKGNTYQPRFSYFPTGRLSFVLDGYTAGLRRNFQDGARQKVEDLLGEIVETLREVAKREKELRAERLVEEKERAKREEVIRLDEAKQKYLADRIRYLEQYEITLKYLQSLKNMANENSTAEFQAWISWVEKFLGRIKREAEKFPGTGDSDSYNSWRHEEAGW